MRSLTRSRGNNTRYGPSRNKGYQRQEQENEVPFESYVYDDALLSAPLNKLQQLALDLVVNKRRNVFITGSAGVGKSFVLKRIVAELRLREHNVAVTASTGVAALNVEGSTLHSFAGLSTSYLGTTQQYTVDIESAWRYKKIWRELDVLIIDEISMINNVYFDRLENAMRMMRENSELPFGGVQLVVVGDFLQLPPVIKNDLYRGIGQTSRTPAKRPATPSSSASIMSSSYAPSQSFITTTPNDASPLPRKVGMCFEGVSWGKCIDHVIELSEVIRQKDVQFVKMLNEIRYGECSEETFLKLERLKRKNKPVVIDIDGGHSVKPTRLYTLNRAVHELNEKELKALPDRQRDFKAETRISVPGWRTMDRQVYRQMEYALTKDMNTSRALESLGLKIGAQVVLVKNISKALVNGSRGVVVGWSPVEDISTCWDVEWINEDLKDFKDWLKENGKMIPIVKFDDGQRMTIGPIVFKVKGPHNSACLRCQIPLQLAWAVSVHRCQGTTLTNRCVVDLSRVWEPGQVYVALSRVTRLENLEIVELNARKSIFAHSKAKQFYEENRKQQEKSIDKLIAEIEPLETLKAPKKQAVSMESTFLPTFPKNNASTSRKRTHSEMHTASKQGTTYKIFITNPRFQKVYAVARGRKLGVFGSWGECKAQVENFVGARFKSFPRIREAEQFLQGHGLKKLGQT